MPKYLDKEDFIAHQTPEIQQLIRYMRQLMSVAHPQMRERFSFQTIFFVCIDYLCYFGKIHPTKGIEIGFVKGHLLKDEANILEAKNRKMVRGITFRNLQDFRAREEAFLEVLQEAILLNETYPEKTFAKLIFEKRKDG
ncbi:MAG: DUF1801 domain-containing protein [Spirosomataceae bacterium]